jgi:CRISPR-associated protein Csm1
VTELQRQLIAYGMHLLAVRLGQEPPGALGWSWKPDGDENDRRITEALRLLGDDSAPGQPLRDLAAIFNFLDPPLGIPSVERAWPPKPLDIGDELRVLPLPEAMSLPVPDRTAARMEVWQNFVDGVLEKLTPDLSFDTFFYLFARHSWFVAGGLRDHMGLGYGRAISVFEQWKATAALAHCLKPDSATDPTVLLVGGDIPGIQEMLYTIGSKGAAKTLRGRSLYLQLLTDAVIRRLLGALDLPWTNMISSAGGNFRLLVPSDADAQLEELRTDLNHTLLDLHRGELSVALAWLPLRAARVADRGPRDNPDSAASVLQEVAWQLESRKRAPFANVAEPRYDDLLSPIGRGGPTLTNREEGKKSYCEVCHTDVGAEAEYEVDGEGDVTTHCRQCHSFPNLAEALANNDTLVVGISQRASAPGVEAMSAASLTWVEALERLGYRYEFTRGSPKAMKNQDRRWVYRLNSTDFRWAPEVGTAHGFRFQARLTPREPRENGTSGAAGQSHVEATEPTLAIRDTHTMANKDAQGLKRYGILRMDVDDLGLAAIGHLHFPDIVHTSALSAALSLFFEGQLDYMCRKAADGWRDWLRENMPKRDGQDGAPHQDDIDSQVPYIIYAGGDDLFMVAPWDVLPFVAHRIRSGFGDYTGNHLTMSGGISLATEKFPLYQAADLALDALESAKENEVRDKDGGYAVGEKNALGFLGTIVGWDEWPGVLGLFERTVRLQAQEEVAHALLWVMSTVANAYRTSARDSNVDPRTGEVVIGPWVWTLHYGLRRLAQRAGARHGGTGLEERILGLADGALDLGQPLDGPKGWSTVRHLGLVARWTEFLTRNKSAPGKET